MADKKVFDWLDIAKQLQSIAQAGLEYGHDKFDLERYQMLRDISVQIMHEHTDAPIEKIIELFANEEGYQTPKVDIRGVVFRNKKLLMVQEGSDKCWTLPGGWGDVGHSPFEVAKKEVIEEANLNVEPVRLLAVFDKSKHSHPPDKYHVYKFFILCKDLGGEVKPGMETLDAKWIGREEKLQLSEQRIKQSQIDTMFDFLDNPDLPTLCD
jgi:ADP-ribose pyrophosphatase YjhB (NUDIX family)